MWGIPSEYPLRRYSPHSSLLQSKSTVNFQTAALSIPTTKESVARWIRGRTTGCSRRKESTVRPAPTTITTIPYPYPCLYPTLAKSPGRWLAIAMPTRLPNCPTTPTRLWTSYSNSVIYHYNNAIWPITMIISQCSARVTNILSKYW